MTDARPQRLSARLLPLDSHRRGGCREASFPPLPCSFASGHGQACVSGHQRI
jgi:hypothetical protein